MVKTNKIDCGTLTRPLAQGNEEEPTVVRGADSNGADIASHELEPHDFLAVQGVQVLVGFAPLSPLTFELCRFGFQSILFPISLCTYDGTCHSWYTNRTTTFVLQALCRGKRSRSDNIWFTPCLYLDKQCVPSLSVWCFYQWISVFACEVLIQMNMLEMPGHVWSWVQSVSLFALWVSRIVKSPVTCHLMSTTRWLGWGT